MSTFQRWAVWTNSSQGEAPKVLFVCTYGILRSPTAAHWAAAHKGWNTRSCGVSAAAVPPLHNNLLEWAERVYVMEQSIAEEIIAKYGGQGDKLRVLNIPDEFSYMDRKLVALIGGILSRE
jgi:predicted protein tyrosine phosphatase